MGILVDQAVEALPADERLRFRASLSAPERTRRKWKQFRVSTMAPVQTAEFAVAVYPVGCTLRHRLPPPAGSSPSPAFNFERRID